MNQAVGKKVALLFHCLQQRPDGAHQTFSPGLEQQARKSGAAGERDCHRAPCMAALRVRRMTCASRATDAYLM